MKITDPEFIRSLIELMEEHDLEELEIVHWRHSVRISRRTFLPQAVTKPKPDHSVTKKVEGPYEVKSELVGTFFLIDPETESRQPYVADGTAISEGQVLGLIQCLGIYKPVISRVQGKVIEILVRNEEPVEYGQVLFKVKLN